MNFTRSLRRAPKWAWGAAAGAGIGAIAIKLHRNRATDATDEGTGADVIGSAPTVGGLPGSPIGTIMPPVIVTPPMGDPNEGVPALQQMYLGALGDVLHGWESLVGPLLTTQTQLALEASPNTLAAIAQAGSAPNSPPAIVPGGEAAAIPVVAVPAPPPPEPAPVPIAAPPPQVAGPTCPPNFPLGNPPECWQFAWNYETRVRGANKWCVKMERHIHQDGRDVTLPGTAQKVHDGPC